MNRRQTLSTLSGLAMAAMPVVLARNVFAKPQVNWTLLSSTTLQPGATRIRFPVDQSRAYMSGLRFGVDGNPLRIRNALLHRGPRTLSRIDINQEVMPGHKSISFFPNGAPFLVRAISLEYEALAGSASETVIHVWVST